MTRQYKKYSDEQLIATIRETESIAATLRKLKLAPVGGNYATIKRYIQKYNIDVSHWVGQGWNKGKQLKNIGSYSRPYKVKEKLAQKRGWKCEMCFQTRWFSQAIPLECHHKDGDRTHNTEENLELLCRNCHYVKHGKI